MFSSQITTKVWIAIHKRGLNQMRFDLEEEFNFVMPSSFFGPHLKHVEFSTEYHDGGWIALGLLCLPRLERIKVAKRYSKCYIEVWREETNSNKKNGRARATANRFLRETVRQAFEAKESSMSIDSNHNKLEYLAFLDPIFSELWTAFDT